MTCKQRSSMTSLEDLAMERIERLIDRAKTYRDCGEDAIADTLIEGARELAAEMDGDDGSFVMRYHRYASDSFGVAFEIDHGDPELMFGGV